MESRVLNSPFVFIQNRQRAGMSCAGQEKQRDDGKQPKLRRRALQNRQRVTLAGLFKALENMVCPSIQPSHNCETNHGLAKVRNTVRVD